MQFDRSSLWRQQQPRQSAVPRSILGWPRPPSAGLLAGGCWPEQPWQAAFAECLQLLFVGHVPRAFFAVLLVFIMKEGFGYLRFWPRCKIISVLVYPTCKPSCLHLKELLFLSWIFLQQYLVLEQQGRFKARAEVLTLLTPYTILGVVGLSFCCVTEIQQMKREYCWWAAGEEQLWKICSSFSSLYNSVILFSTRYSKICMSCSCSPYSPTRTLLWAEMTDASLCLIGHGKPST